MNVSLKINTLVWDCYWCVKIETKFARKIKQAWEGSRQDLENFYSDRYSGRSP